MQALTQQSYCFEEFELNAANRELRRAGEPVQLSARAFDLLLMLVEHNNRLIGKDEIFERVWQNQIVEESNLTVHISQIRKALGETKNKPRFITTVPGYGYRFSGEVTVGSEERDFVVEEETFTRVTIDREQDISEKENELAAVAENQLLSDTTISFKTKSSLETRKRFALKPRNKIRSAILIACGLLILILSVLIYFQQRSSNQHQASNRIKSIAVLPFKPLVVENRNESLEMGMADTLIAKLSNLREINVRPLSAIRNYTALEQDAVAAGREQKVDAVLDGQIQQSGEKIRMTIRLVRVNDAATVWTKQFDEKITDIFSLQDSISERVAEVLALKLTGDEKKQLGKHQTENTEAYRHFLMARFHFAKRTEEAMKKSIGYFNQAIETDPNYAAAYAGLADAYSTLGWFDFLAPEEAYGKAREAIGKALQMDDEIANAHAVLGDIKRGYDWDLAAAEKSYQRALELDPNVSMTYHSYALTLAFMERYDEAVKAIRQAQQLDPLSVAVNNSYGEILLFARRHDEAIEQFRKVLEIETNNQYTYTGLGYCYFQKNLYREAAAEFVKAAKLSGKSSEEVQALESAFEISGINGFWKELIEQESSAKNEYVSSYNIAGYYAMAGEKERALDWLEKAYREHSSGMAAVRADFFFDNLRSEARYIDLMRRIESRH